MTLKHPSLGRAIFFRSQFIFGKSESDKTRSSRTKKREQTRYPLYLLQHTCNQFLRNFQNLFGPNLGEVCPHGRSLLRGKGKNRSLERTTAITSLLKKARASIDQSKDTLSTTRPGLKKLFPLGTFSKQVVTRIYSIASIHGIYATFQQCTMYSTSPL